MHKIIMIQIETEDERIGEVAEDVTFYLALDERSLKPALVDYADITPPANRVASVATKHRPTGRVKVAREVTTGTRAGDWYYLPGQPEVMSEEHLVVKSLHDMSAVDWARLEFPPSYEVQRLRNQVWGLSDADRGRLFWELLRSQK